MPITYPLLVGVLVGVAVYLLLHRDAVDKVFGIVVLGHAANLVVLGAGKLAKARAPIAGPGRPAPTDPLPQALVLTAIVLAFGLVAFAVVLVARDQQEHREPR